MVNNDHVKLVKDEVGLKPGQDCKPRLIIVYI